MPRKFVEIDCRFCPKGFCCSKCRFKHEQRKHDLKIDCDICVYGKILFKNRPGPLFEHIKETHFPLHCLNCKLIFNDMTELTENHKCKPAYESPLNKNAESIIISGNMETKFDENSPLSMAVYTTLTTSTPVGSVKQEQRMSAPSLHSINEQGNSIDDRSKKPINRSPLDASTSKQTNELQVPLVTPLRSIIAKGKFQSNFGESGNKRKVKFFKEIQHQLEIGTINPVHNTEQITEEILYFTPSENSSLEKIKYFPNILPSTPSIDKPEIFYTPEAYYERQPQSLCCETETAAETEKNAGDENFVGPLSSLGQMWNSMANAFKNVFMQVPTPAPISDTYEMLLSQMGRLRGFFRQTRGTEQATE